jgi:type II secretory pathway pseudopilin PulG
VSFVGDAGGFSLIETVVATALLATAVVSLAQLFGLATSTNTSARKTTYATVLAEQKLEELRALAWGYDAAGLPFSDTSSDTAAVPETATGGTGLTPSPAGVLDRNIAGYVDHVDQSGNKLGGGETPPAGALYTRRWAVQPLPSNPRNTLVLQVLVTAKGRRGAADSGAAKRLPDEARLVTVKTRKAP